MGHTPNILAIDLGTSGCKSALVSITGEVLAWEFEPVPLIVLPGGGAEQDPNEWWRAFLVSAKRMIERSPSHSQDIIAVCCSAQGEGTLPVDAQGNALGNAILWMDMRGAPYLDSINRGLLKVAGYDLFKLIRWMRLTGGAPNLTGKDPAAHMLLVRYEQPDRYQKTAKFLNVLDYINLKLTGRCLATPDSILTSWVTDNRDTTNIQYHDGLLRDCGIEAEKFPEIVPCTSVIGELLPDIARTLGLKSGIQVVAGSIDTTSSAIGSGAIQDYDAHLYIGTSSWIAAHVPFKKTDVFSSLASVPCAIPGKYLMTIMQTTAGGNLTYLRDSILYHKDELLAEAHTPDVYKIIDQIAARVPAGSRGIIYTPWIHGERSPVEDRFVRASLFNISLNTSREDIIRAFLEGVALNSRWMLKPAEKFLGKTINRLNLVGGGATSDIWCQIFADVMNLEIRQVLNPIQVNACGAAYIAAVGMGLLRYEDIPNSIAIKAVYQPNPENRATYDRIFSEFVNLYRQNRGIYRRLNA